MHQDHQLLNSEPDRILIAEDNHDFCDLLQRRASSLRCDVTSVENTTSAIELLEQRNFDLLVVDLYMPDGTGLDILEAARAKDEDIQAIVMTGSATLENAVDSLRAGVSDYLIKPFEPFTIFDLAVLRALDRRRLVKENKRLFLENQRLATRDPLTGLLNRFQMRKVLHQEIRRAERYNRSLAVLMIDMDSFKKINDDFGHIKGDEVLVHVARILEQSIRKVDTAARFGGDEFLVIMPEAGMEIAGEVTLRILSQVRYPLNEIGPISLSVGAAVWDTSMESIENFLKAADDSMYREKANRHRKSSGVIKSRVCAAAGS